MSVPANTSLQASRNTWWVVRCTVCAYAMSGRKCFTAAGMRGFFYCPNCRSGLEMRGRWIMAGIIFLVLCALGGFTFYFVEYLLHRTIGLVLGYSAEAAALIFIWYLCLKLVVKVGRQDVDASFVL